MHTRNVRHHVQNELINTVVRPPMKYGRLMVILEATCTNGTKLSQLRADHGSVLVYSLNDQKPCIGDLQQLQRPSRSLKCWPG